MKTSAIVFDKPGSVTLQSLEVPQCGPQEILCQTRYTFVSPGTELRCLDAQYSKPEDFPLIPGYAAIAQVVEVGAEVTGYKVGDWVTGRNPNPFPGIKSMWGGQAGMHLYPAEGEIRPVLLPEGADPHDYVIAEVAAISLRGITAAAPRPGESAIVIGQGTIGAFSAAWLHAAGCRVIACDLDDSRLARARDYGITQTVNMQDADAMNRLTTLTNGGADIVVEASGVPAGILAAYQLIRRKPQAYGESYKVEPIHFYHGDWPRLVMQANYTKEITINPFTCFPGEGVTLLAPMDRGIEDRQRTVAAIATGQLRASPFLDACLPVAHAPNGYAILKKHEAFSVVFDWQNKS